MWALFILLNKILLYTFFWLWKQNKNKNIDKNLRYKLEFIYGYLNCFNLFIINYFYYFSNKLLTFFSVINSLIIYHYNNYNI